MNFHIVRRGLVEMNSRSLALSEDKFAKVLFIALSELGAAIERNTTCVWVFVLRMRLSQATHPRNKSGMTSLLQGGMLVELDDDEYKVLLK